MSEQATTTQQAASTYSLDGKQITLIELNEARAKPGIKIVETAPGVFKTLQRLNG